MRRSGPTLSPPALSLFAASARSDAPTISRREFLRELNAVLPEALDEMTKGSGDDRSPVAPVDLSQAIIGPGMAVFSKYAAVLEADGSPMSCPHRPSAHQPLSCRGRFRSRHPFLPALVRATWLERRPLSAMPTRLSRGKGTSVDGMKDAGVIRIGGGIVRLSSGPNIPADWDPQSDARLPVWEALHQFIRALKQWRRIRCRRDCLPP